MLTGLLPGLSPRTFLRKLSFACLSMALLAHCELGPSTSITNREDASQTSPQASLLEGASDFQLCEADNQVWPSHWLLVCLLHTAAKAVVLLNILI